MKTNTLLTALFASAVVGLTACGDGSQTTDDPAAADAAVEIAESEYRPADLEVAAGTSVTWTNDDQLPHTVAFEDASLGSSEQLDEGDRFTVTFQDGGTFPYVCTLHPGMTGSVTVTD